MLLNISHRLKLNQVILDDAWLKVSSCSSSRCMKSHCEDLWLPEETRYSYWIGSYKKEGAWISRHVSHEHCMQKISRVVLSGQRGILVLFSIFGLKMYKLLLSICMNKISIVSHQKYMVLTRIPVKILFYVKFFLLYVRFFLLVLYGVLPMKLIFWIPLTTSVTFSPLINLPIFS